jgi:hypothetical protein
MNNERLKPSEPKKKSEQVSPAPEVLTVELAESVILSRREQLNKLEGIISKKYYYKLEERIQEEVLEFEKLLNWQKGKKQILSQYTFVLDQQYFEQKIL